MGWGECDDVTGESVRCEVSHSKCVYPTQWVWPTLNGCIYPTLSGCGPF